MREPRSSNAGKAGQSDERVDPKSLQPLKRLLPFVLRYPVRLALTLLFLLACVAAVWWIFRTGYRLKT